MPSLHSKQMSANDSLGTSAAQIAAAASHPLALDRIERMMADTLSALPKDSIVPWKTKRRLYELAYAFALVGERGKLHLAPLRQLMTMKVQSWAPPFGMIENPPKRICDLLTYIVGASSADDQAYPYCADDKIPYDRPRNIRMRYLLESGTSAKIGRSEIGTRPDHARVKPHCHLCLACYVYHKIAKLAAGHARRSGFQWRVLHG